MSSWWRIVAADPYWVPPPYVALRRALDPNRNSHLARLNPLLVHAEALPRRQGGFSSATFEVPVAAAAALGDPRRRDGTAYLALLHCINDTTSLERLILYLAESLAARGYRRVLAPTGLSPHLGTGLLQDHWNSVPPLHTPYNPPYLPEIAGSVLRARSRSQLFFLEVPAEPPAKLPGKMFATLRPLDVRRLAVDLLPLLVAACPPWLDFAPPDRAEASFLLSWLGQWPSQGWIAQVDAEAVGFILIQPDLGPGLRRAKGGRNPIWRLWLAWASRRPVRHGRVLFAAVVPEWRKQGIGRLLFQKAIDAAQQLGWQSLSVGPVPGTSGAAKFLTRLGAQPRQTYIVYQYEL
jgi:GNAT superfamily N-acetyltransferase